MRFCPRCERRFDDDATERCPDDGERTLPSPKPALHELPGRVIEGRWQVDALLGEGGMGAVFTGVQVNLERPVAIKVLQPQVASSETVIARFFREARVLSTLQHPHIVTILDFGRDEASGLLYLVMERLHGEPLDVWLRNREQVRLDAVLTIAEHVTSALVEAHERSIVHRDLKPQNVFVTRVAAGLHAKVLDFGIAKVDDEALETLTRTGHIQGTPHYMAPEQIQGGPIGPAADLYALGGMLYEVLSGAPVFDAGGVMAILMQHCQAPVPSLRERWALREAPLPRLLALTERLLAKQPAARPASAVDVLAELQLMRADRRSGTEHAPLVLPVTLEGPLESVPRAGSTPPSGTQGLDTARYRSADSPVVEEGEVALEVVSLAPAGSSSPALAQSPAPVAARPAGISPAVLILAAAIVLAGALVALALGSGGSSQAVSGAPAAEDPAPPAASGSPPALPAEPAAPARAEPVRETAGTPPAPRPPAEAAATPSPEGEPAAVELGVTTPVLDVAVEPGRKPREGGRRRREPRAGDVPGETAPDETSEDAELDQLLREMRTP